MMWFQIGNIYSADNFLVTEASDVVCFYFSFSSRVAFKTHTIHSVYSALNLINGQVIAVKQVNYTNLDKKDRSQQVKALETEIQMLKELKHPNVEYVELIVTSIECTFFLSTVVEDRSRVC